MSIELEKASWNKVNRTPPTIPLKKSEIENILLCNCDTLGGKMNIFDSILNFII